jgi:hypothetical protein
MENFDDLRLKTKINDLIKHVVENNWHYGAGEIIDMSKFREELENSFYKFVKDSL